MLQDAALACHASLLKHAAREPGGGRFATTLTLFLGLWPHAYLLQVGDSRCYLFQAGELTQIRRDHDGLTKHVPDSRISERIDAMTSSRQLCEDLVWDALDDGGSDNITIVVGRTLRPGDT